MTGVDEDERLARVALSCVIEPGEARLTRLVRHEGAVAMLARLRTDTADPVIREARENFAARLDTVDPERTLAQAADRGLRFVAPGDAEWPPCLEDLEHVPELYLRGDVPIGLWVRGTGDLAALAEHAVAIVGSRSSTTYGVAVARDLATGVARAGHTVVSGGAFGIDQAAHRGALSVDGRTIAVLACGADRAYPDAHRDLLDLVAARGGVVVSEAPPGAAPMRIRFLSRNRLIAALAAGTVVVEAAIRSGALNTATWANGMARQLLGVPGPVTSEPSEGVHQLIRTRGALLVTRAEEVLEAVSPVGTFTLREPREPARPRDSLDTWEQQVLDAVPVVAGAPVHNIARAAGLSPDRTARILERLFRGGLVEQSRNLYRLSLKGSA